MAAISRRGIAGQGDRRNGCAPEPITPAAQSQADEASPMISLTDDELAAVMTAAQPIAPDRRDAFLHQVAEASRGCREIGPGAVHRAIVVAQRSYFDPPILDRHGRRTLPVPLAYPGMIKGFTLSAKSLFH